VLYACSTCFLEVPPRHRAQTVFDIGRRGAVSGILFLASPATAEQPEQPAAIPITGSAKAMPAIGFGTCCRADVKGTPIIQAAKTYLASGGRLIDTAQLYENHKDLNVAIKESGVPRDQLWVTSKILVCGNQRVCATTGKAAFSAVEKSNAELGLDYTDLMLLHGAEGWGVSEQSDVDLWRGLIEAQSAGKVRNIGVSNHNRKEIENLIAATGVKPAVNQIEFHPWVPEETKELVRWCQSQGIAVTAYGSLGGEGNKANGKVIKEIAEKQSVSKSQVLLRWALNHGVAVIPGSNNPAHIMENLDLVRVKLDAEDSKALENAQKPERFRRWHSCKSGCAS